MDRKIVGGIIVVLSISAVIAMTATAAAQPAPGGFTITGLVNNYCTGDSVNNADVTVKNLNTSAVFTTSTGQLFWWANYQFIIPSVSAGNMLHFTTSDTQGNSSDFNYTATGNDIFLSGFKQDITIGACGDADCDRDVDGGDVTRLFTHIVHDVPANQWAADVDSDGDVDGGDVIRLSTHIAHETPVSC